MPLAFWIPETFILIVWFLDIFVSPTALPLSCSLMRHACADMLRKNSSLQELMLWSTGLRQDGASHVLRALHSNSSLQRLDLGCNELGPEVCPALEPGWLMSPHTVICKAETCAVL